MQCTAMSKAKLRQGLPKSECRCKRRAVEGYTVCQIHGAGSPYKGRKGGRPLIHGRNSKKPSTPLQELVEQYKSDEELCNLDNDIALLRALLDIRVSQIDLTDKKDVSQNINGVRDLMRDIRYSVQQKNDMMSQYLIPIENIQTFLQNVMLVLSANIQDKELLAKIVQELQSIRIMEQDIYDSKRYGIGQNNYRKR